MAEVDSPSGGWDATEVYPLKQGYTLTKLRPGFHDDHWIFPTRRWSPSP